MNDETVNDETKETETTSTNQVTTTPGTAVADPTKVLGGRLGNLVAKEANIKLPEIVELVDVAFGEGEGSIESDEVFAKAKSFLEKIGIFESFLSWKGIETPGNISEWRPALAAINSGKGKSAADLRHLDLNVMYNFGTKTAIDLATMYYPVFIHGEEVLTDDSGLNVLDRVTTIYTSTQEASNPGYTYQNVLYLVDQGFTEVFKVNIKSAGHKYSTNLLRNYMLPNYSRGVVFDKSKLVNWLNMEVVSHTSKAGFTNPYPKLTVSKTPVVSDETILIEIIQRAMFEDFHKNLAKANEAKASDAEAQNLVESNTVTNAAGETFTNL